MAARSKKLQATDPNAHWYVTTGNEVLSYRATWLEAERAAKRHYRKTGNGCLVLCNHCGENAEHCKCRNAHFYP